MKQTTATLSIWIIFVLFTAFIFYFSSIEDIGTAHNYSKALELTTYFLSFGFSSILLFRALIYTFRFSVDRLSLANDKKEQLEDAEFRLIIEVILIFLTISLNTNLVLVNHSIIEQSAGRDSSTYAVLLNILGVSIFSFISFVWPLLEKNISIPKN